MASVLPAPEGSLPSPHEICTNVSLVGCEDAQAPQEPADSELIETASVSSALECPICFGPYCEPVRPGCGRHVFCRNCLLKSQQPGAPLRCPICRRESLLEVSDLPEDVDLVARLRAKDPKYDEHVALARAEREEHMRSRYLRSMSLLPDVGIGRQFEVCGAGTAEVNGVYFADVLPGYMGPTVYRKPSTYIFIFRWHRTQWIIANRRSLYSLGNERGWLYRAPTQHPPDIPPVHGWEVPSLGRACNPAPEVRLFRGSTHAAAGHNSIHMVLTRSVPANTGSNATTRETDGQQVRCRCSVPCSIM
eukprot:gnl/TRDRNA2_/TRDRNA2_28199_c0_seq1.p1 gnl/TRDRNA2_/TRDRNA2_28199_c0~~gnl/TRDRNA2_/TRDRNA2_28199_c0_seq1.p1  ORF type:complete len:305 (-),score=21.06 gnl/TRDRNA2_/TRDRNA2_28199_c0_seq1:64-978(-)